MKKREKERKKEQIIGYAFVASNVNLSVKTVVYVHFIYISKSVKKASEESN